jgi:hypothetical protein
MTLYVIILVRGDRIDLPVEVPDKTQQSYDRARREAERAYPGSKWIGVY